MRLTHYDEHKKRWQINDDHGAVMIDELNYAVGEAIDKLAAYLARNTENFAKPSTRRALETKSTRNAAGKTTLSKKPSTLPPSLSR